MLVNIKYHLVTIMALFITLAIGILIGSTIIGNDSIIKQQQKLISNLKTEFKTLRKENKNFKTEINNLENKLAVNLKYRRKILSFLLKNKLTGEKILIINSSNIEEELANKLITHLQLANPEVIESATEAKLKENKYSKIIILGQANKQSYEKYFNANTKIVYFSKEELNKFSKIIEKVLAISQNS